MKSIVLKTLLKIYSFMFYKKSHAVLRVNDNNFIFNLKDD